MYSSCDINVSPSAKGNSRRSVTISDEILSWTSEIMCSFVSDDVPPDSRGRIPVRCQLCFIVSTLTLFHDSAIMVSESKMSKGIVGLPVIFDSS